MRQKQNLNGQKFGRLTVLKFARRDAGYRALWLCECECGNTCVVEGHNLQSGHSKSCGCFRKETSAERGKLRIKHGHCKKGRRSRTYSSFAHMVSRCCNPNDAHFSRYGGRAIRVCKRWRNSFQNFLSDLGERPEGRSLDRYPNPDGDYEPGNVRWATRRQQARNKSKLTAKKAMQIRRAAQVFDRKELVELFDMPLTVIANVIGPEVSANV